MKQPSHTDKQMPIIPKKARNESIETEEAVQTGLNEDPDMRKIHDAALDDSFDRGESELDD
ncbi:MAG: hypothetical protein H7259_07830 [Cytophagales bacterium]|nr:hypothetical protein [Cytophaga sp.]